MDECAVKLIVGLGNPGSRYRHTRHNLGFLVIEELAKEWGTTFKTVARFNAELSKIEKKGQVYLLKPSTFMNLSGFSVKKCMQYYKIKRDQVLIINDDAALQFGDLRLKPKGGSGGHNGLKHIEGQIGSEYPRLKMGIGYPNRGELEDYVLGKFTEKEMTELGAFISDAVQVIESWVNEGLEVAMNQANIKKSDEE